MIINYKINASLHSVRRTEYGAPPSSLAALAALSSHPFPPCGAKQGGAEGGEAKGATGERREGCAINFNYKLIIFVWIDQK